MAFQLPEKPQRGSQTQEEKSNFQAIVPTERYPEGKVIAKNYLTFDYDPKNHN